MKRFHVHVAVTNLEDSIDFYSKLFGQQPSKQQADYAKWMLEEPRVNFAISARGLTAGVNHFGFQVDSSEELQAIRQLAESAAAGAVSNSGVTACCYAKSEKYWILDPQGLAWEHFHTLTDTLKFGADTAAQDGTCCIPVHTPEQDAATGTAACCIPKDVFDGKDACCS
ncbi:MAG: ArsI/CadI family heavy metal resistance metalloenzyme [Pseudomonadota bacterium]